MTINYQIKITHQVVIETIKVSSNQEDEAAGNQFNQMIKMIQVRICTIGIKT